MFVFYEIDKYRPFLMSLQWFQDQWEKRKLISGHNWKTIIGELHCSTHINAYYSFKNILIKILWRLFICLFMTWKFIWYNLCYVSYYHEKVKEMFAFYLEASLIINKLIIDTRTKFNIYARRAFCLQKTHHWRSNPKKFEMQETSELYTKW